MSAENPWAPNKFLSEHGFSLLSEGSADRALNYQCAHDFLTLLKDNGIPPLGIEVWRRNGNRRQINSTGGWFADDLQAGGAAKDALNFIYEFRNVEQTIFTIQF